MIVVFRAKNLFAVFMFVLNFNNNMKTIDFAKKGGKSGSKSGGGKKCGTC